MEFFEIMGDPIAWKRAGGCGNRYFDRQLKEKHQVQWELKESYGNLKCHIKPIKAIFEFHMTLPTSWSKKKREITVKTPHKSKPDIDNLQKFISDALNGILWKDDALIYEVHAKKFYSYVPRTIIHIEEYDEGRENLHN